MNIFGKVNPTALIYIVETKMFNCSMNTCAEMLQLGNTLELVGFVGFASWKFMAVVDVACS